MSGKDPAVIVNFKVYSEIEGENALRLSKICDSIAEETGANIIVCPPTVALSYVADPVSIPVYSLLTSLKPSFCGGIAMLFSNFSASVARFMKLSSK